jgi:hypothetical protein
MARDRALTHIDPRSRFHVGRLYSLTFQTVSRHLRKRKWSLDSVTEKALAHVVRAAKTFHSRFKKRDSSRSLLVRPGLPKAKRKRKENLRHEHYYRQTAISSKRLPVPIHEDRGMLRVTLENVAFIHASPCNAQL